MSVSLSSDCENKAVNSNRLVACITTLYLFSKIRAQLMVKHAMTMQPYLTSKCNVSDCANSLFAAALKLKKSHLRCIPDRKEVERKWSG